MKYFNIENYINSSIKNNIGSLQNYLFEAKKSKKDTHFDILASLYGDAAKAVRAQDAIENAEKIYRARYLEARAAYYGQGAKKTAEQAKVIKTKRRSDNKKSEPGDAVQGIVQRIASTPSPPQEQDLFTGLPSDQGHTNQVIVPEPSEDDKSLKKIRGRTSRTSEIATSVVKKASGSNKSSNRRKEAKKIADSDNTNQPAKPDSAA